MTNAQASPSEPHKISTRVTGCVYSVDEAPQLGVRQTPIAVNLTYRRTNPFEITADFPNSAGDVAVTWCIGRETLSAGLTATAEMSYEADRLVSDIQIGTHALRWHDWTLLTLSSPSGTAEIGLPTYELIQFVTRTEDIVPAGTEAELITDAHLAELFEV